MMLIFLVAAFATTAYCQITEVAFSAGLTHDLSVKNATVIQFNLQYTNIGGGYSTATGRFTAPQSGIYLFQWHLLSQQVSSAWLELYKNAQYIASAFGESNTDYASGGNSVILTLTKGDEVYVKNVNDKDYPTDLYGRTDEVYGTFSGYLVSKIDQVIPAAGK